ncbi:aminopeptidase [Candidatus Phytoplasma sacchari]|uniref:Aminopeptidase n=1 Tax=Candidatus Phytoplasma sacchari TaxID=2609813 RepID=A0ABY7M391_9MOLU|nr:aminopeptidase [Candidatus Phytoplasma sacchari]
MFKAKNINLLKKYAKLILKIGVNIQKGQTIFIKSFIENSFFVRIITEEAYLLGVKKVNVIWQDDDLHFLDLKYANFHEIKSNHIFLKKYFHYLIKEKAVYIYLISPFLSKEYNIDENNFFKFNLYQKKEFIFFDKYIKSSEIQWASVVLPNKKWAKIIFPKLSEKKALEKFYSILFDWLFINKNDENDAEFFKKWQKHILKLSNFSTKLNNFNFKFLHFYNNIGTNFQIGLNKDHIWRGGFLNSKNNISFTPNLPTEEVLTVPDKYVCEGKIVATRPLNFQNKIIKDFWLEIKNGKIFNYNAKIGFDTLKHLINIDKYSCYIGEIAIVPYHFNFNNLNIIFFETLLDENTSSHIAFGQSYPFTYSRRNSSINNSSIHVDITFGSSDLKIIGETREKKKITIFEKGDFII